MNDLEKYVEDLFKHQNNSDEILELKEEILTNLIEKKNDLMFNGHTEKSAMNIIKSDFSSIDGLIDDNQLTYLSKYHIECIQISIISSIIFLILTFPFILDGYYVPSYLSVIMIIAFSIIYLFMKHSEKNTISFISFSSIKKKVRLVWLIWTVFFIVSTILIFSIKFSSNLWFGTSLNISGPYDLYTTILPFYASLITIVLPITVSVFSKSLIKYKRR